MVANCHTDFNRAFGGPSASSRVQVQASSRCLLLAYRRHVLGDQIWTELNPLLLRHLEGIGQSEAETLESVAATGRLNESSAASSLFATALEISPEPHFRVQAAFQKHVDNAVSTTINLPREAAPRDVAKAYMLAHGLGCKGVTVFRYG